MQNYLLVGGGHDGLSFPVEDDQDEVRIPAGVTSSEVYVRDTLSAGDMSITIFRHESLMPEQFLDRVVAYYRAWAINRPGGRR